MGVQARKIEPRLMPPPARLIPHVAADALREMLSPARCALLVIDVQQDFAGPEGALALAGADMSGVEPAMTRILGLIDAARVAGAAVAFARVMTTPSTDTAALKLLNARKGRAPEDIAICREGGAGGAYHGVEPRPGDIEVSKRLFSAFHGTDLERDLRARGVDTLVVVGFATHCCVDSTCRDAFHRDFNVFVVSDATDAYSPDLHQGALMALSEICALVVDAQSVAAAWGPGPGGQGAPNPTPSSATA